MSNLDKFEDLFLEVKAMYKDVLPRKNLKISKVYSQLTRLSRELSRLISKNFFTLTKSLFDEFEIDYK